MPCLLPACYSVDRGERPLSIRVESYPSGASISVRCTSAEGDTATAVPLGRAPLTVERLSVVRKVFVSGEADYWLRDYARKMPANSSKPPYASPAYLSGNDYPYRLAFTGTLEGASATATIVIDREAMRRAYEAGEGTIQVKLNVAHSIAPTR